MSNQVEAQLPESDKLPVIPASTAAAAPPRPSSQPPSPSTLGAAAPPLQHPHHHQAQIPPTPRNTPEAQALDPRTPGGLQQHTPGAVFNLGSLVDPSSSFEQLSPFNTDTTPAPRPYDRDLRPYYPIFDLDSSEDREIQYLASGLSTIEGTPEESGLNTPDQKKVPTHPHTKLNDLQKALLNLKRLELLEEFKSAEFELPKPPPPPVFSGGSSSSSYDISAGDVVSGRLVPDSSSNFGEEASNSPPRIWYPNYQDPDSPLLRQSGVQTHRHTSESELEDYSPPPPRSTSTPINWDVGTGEPADLEEQQEERPSRQSRKSPPTWYPNHQDPESPILRQSGIPALSQSSSSGTDDLYCIDPLVANRGHRVAGELHGILSLQLNDKHQSADNGHLDPDILPSCLQDDIYAGYSVKDVQETACELGGGLPTGAIERAHARWRGITTPLTRQVNSILNSPQHIASPPTSGFHPSRDESLEQFPPRIPTRALPATLQNLIEGGHSLPVIEAVGERLGRGLKYDIHYAHQKWRELNSPCSQVVLKSLAPSGYSRIDSEDPVEFERKIKRDFYRDFVSKGLPALVDDKTTPGSKPSSPSSEDSYFEERAFPAVSRTLPRSRSVDSDPARDSPTDISRRSRSVSPGRGLVRSRHRQERSTSRAQASGTIHPAPTPQRPLPSEQREKVSKVTMSRKDGHRRRVTPPTSSQHSALVKEIVMAMGQSMACLLTAHGDDMRDQMGGMEARMDRKLGLVREEVKVVDDRSQKTASGQDRMERAMQDRHRSAIERGEDFTLRVSEKLTEDMKDMREDMRTDMEQRFRSLDIGRERQPRPFISPSAQTPSPIHQVGAAGGYSPGANPGGICSSSHPRYSTPSPHTTSQDARQPSMHFDVAGNHPSPPSYANLSTQAIPVSGVTPTHQMAPQLNSQQQRPGGRDMGVVTNSIYMSTPNQPPGGTNHGHSYADHHNTGHPAARQDARQHMSQQSRAEIPELRENKYTSAQLSSFTKPKVFSRQTAYRSAEKFLSEYKFFVEAMHPTSEYMQAKCMYGHLDGRAASWYFTNVMDKPLMYNRDAMYAAFLERFSGEDPETVIKGYRNRKQKAGESVEDYMTDMISLLSNSQLDEKTQVDYLINGFRPEIGNPIRCELPGKITDVERLATKTEVTITSLSSQLKQTPSPAAELCELGPTQQRGRPWNENSGWNSSYRNNSREARLGPGNNRPYNVDYQSRFNDRRERGFNNYNYRNDSRGRDDYRGRSQDRYRNYSPHYNPPRSYNDSGNYSRNPRGDYNNSYRRNDQQRSNSGNFRRSQSQERSASGGRYDRSASRDRYRGNTSGSSSNNSSNNNGGQRERSSSRGRDQQPRGNDSRQGRPRDPTPGRGEDRNRSRDRQERASSQDRGRDRSRDSSRGEERQRSSSRPRD